MAFLCSADSGNLMAVARQVIQQQQQRQQQRPDPHRDPTQIQMTAVTSFPDLFHFESAPPAADCGSSAFFDPDEWMEGLIGGSPDDLHFLFNAAAKEPPPLMQSLLDCARLLDSDPDLAVQPLARIRASSSDSGDPAERVGFYFSEALLRPPPSPPDFPPEELFLCYKVLDDACPYIKFAYLTANQAILDAAAAALSVHVIDVGFVEGVQWAPLLQALATRSSGKPARVRITGVGRPVAAAGDRLGRFATDLGLEFEFQAVPDLAAAGELRLCAGEAVAVNFMHQLPSRGSDEILSLVKTMSPTVITLGEYVAGHDAGDLTGVVSHHAAVFESLEPAMDRGSPERRLLERRLLGPRLMAALTRTGPQPRMRGTAQWRALMEKAGFESVAPSHYAVSQAGILLWNYNYSDNFSVVDSDPPFLSLAWRGQPLLSVSSWR